MAAQPARVAREGIRVLTTNLSSTRTVERALELLAVVCADGASTLSECARSTGLPASTALRLLRTLESAGFVARDQSGSFHAGSRLIQLGAAALGRQSLVRLAEPALQRIVSATGESAYLSIAGPDRTAIYLAMVEGTHPVRHTSWVGRAVEMTGLAVGTALDGTTPAIGYVAERDRTEPDVTAVAAPIDRPGNPGRPLGALTLLGPTYRIDDATMHDYGVIVAREARGLSVLLGVDAAVPIGVEDAVPIGVEAAVPIGVDAAVPTAPTSATGVTDTTRKVTAR